jgi:hypothetical protein
VEQIVREVVPKNDLKIIVSNIGTTPGFQLHPDAQFLPAARPLCRWD